MSEALMQWFPSSGRDPDEGRGGPDVESQDSFREDSIIMPKFKQNDRET